MFFQVGLPDDGDDVYDRHVLPAGDSHRTGLERLNSRNCASRERRVNSEDDDEEEKEEVKEEGEKTFQSILTESPVHHAVTDVMQSTKQGNACRLSPLFYGALVFMWLVGGVSPC